MSRANEDAKRAMGKAASRAARRHAQETPSNSNELAEWLQRDDYHAMPDDNDQAEWYKSDLQDRVEEPPYVINAVFSEHEGAPDESGGKVIVAVAPHNAGAAIYHADDGTWEPIDWSKIYGPELPSTMRQD